jgi:anti-sigma regulatory factor (Ser/Thr protein kinase)
MSSPDSGVSLAERLGGRWAISWQALFITAPWTLVALVIAGPAQPSLWLVIGVIASALVVGWTYLMHRTVFRDRAEHPVSIGWIAFSSLGAATLFVGTAIGLGLAWNAGDAASLSVRLMPLFFVIVAWGPLVSLVLDSHWRYRVQRGELIQQYVQQQLANAQELDVLNEVRESLRREVGEQVVASNRDLIQRIDGLVDAGEADFGVIARDLRASADSSVRPLSHRLEQRARRAHQNPGFFMGLRNIFRYQPFRPLAVSIVYAVLTTPRSIVENGLMIGLSVLAVTVAFIFSIMIGFNGAMHRWPQHHSAIFIIGLVAVQAPTVVLSPLRMELTGEVISIGDLIISMVIGTYIVLATSSFGAWDRSRREMIADFRREVDEETIATLVRGQALAKATMDAAIALHGSVQTQLHACALTLEEANRRGDLVEVNRALVHARALLERPDLAPRTATEMSLQDVVEVRIAQWRGLLAVSVSIDARAGALSGVIAGHLADVVEEAIANALHHGSATSVLAAITCAGDELLVQVHDNGSGPLKGAPGLGSRLFSAYGSRWSLGLGDSGAALAVVLPRSVG